jgi:hypothetical protein
MTSSAAGPRYRAKARARRGSHRVITVIKPVSFRSPTAARACSSRGRPFEIIVAAPGAAPMTQQVEAISCALCAVLREYRSFIAQGAYL